MCIVWEERLMNKMFAVIHYEFKMQFFRLGSWGIFVCLHYDMHFSFGRYSHLLYRLPS